MWVQIWHFIAGVVNVKWLKFIADQIVADCFSDSFTYTQHCAGKCEFVFLLSVFYFFLNWYLNEYHELSQHSASETRCRCEHNLQMKKKTNTNLVTCVKNKCEIQQEQAKANLWLISGWLQIARKSVCWGHWWKACLLLKLNLGVFFSAICGKPDTLCIGSLFH